ncbi:MAG: hypothetical protein RBT70_06745 [Alphaproteobacteria bacterium]|jgi:hypothetical protein|nr:hypothetical protein [Alphaproteobacteria bacterium]NCC11153.1 hypothetical protein [Bacteroidia bacterium]
MSLDFSSLPKILSPAILTRAVRSFDKTVTLFVSVGWGAVIVVWILAIYTIHLSVTARSQLAEASAKEPSLPIIEKTSVPARQIEKVMERLKKKFPDVTVSAARDSSVNIIGTEGSRFKSWMYALSYIEIISPEYYWEIKEMCVGAHCGANSLMKVVLTPQKIIFKAPEVSSDP